MFIALEGAEFVIIMGVDPGIATVGFGFLSVDKQRQAVLQYGTVTTPAELPLSTRLLQIAEDLETLIAQFHPDEMAVEELFFNTNVKTGISVAHGRGVILLTAEKCGLPIYEYTPLQVKQAVAGYGRAEKRQVMRMTQRLLKLASLPRPDDVADALAVALCHGRSSSSLLRNCEKQCRTV